MPSDQTDKIQREPATAGGRMRGRSALLAHAMAQRENRLFMERRDAKSRLEERSAEQGAKADPKAGPKAGAKAGSERDTAAPRPAPARPGSAGTSASSVAGLNRPKPKPALIAEAMAARRPNGEPAGLDAMVAEALGRTASRHQHDDGFDREAALTDLIARTQARLGTAEPVAPAPTPAKPAPASAANPPASTPDREAAIAAAMRTHRERQGEVFEDLTVRQRATLRAAAEAMVDRAERK